MNMLKYAKSKYTYICNNTICINMHKICTRSKYVIYLHKYALYAEICTWINMQLYANLNMHKYARNMLKYANICSDPINISPMHSHAFLCTKYAQNMQDM